MTVKYRHHMSAPLLRHDLEMHILQCLYIKGLDPFLQFCSVLALARIMCQYVTSEQVVVRQEFCRQRVWRARLSTAYHACCRYVRVFRLSHTNTVSAFGFPPPQREVSPWLRVFGKTNGQYYTYHVKSAERNRTPHSTVELISVCFHARRLNRLLHAPSPPPHRRTRADARGPSDRLPTLPRLALPIGISGGPLSWGPL